MYKFKVSLSVTAILLLLTAAGTTISTTVTENTFAEKYGNNQAAATSNSCLNPLFESSTLDIPNTIGNCGNTVSQQEESGQASSPITLQTASPTIEVQAQAPTMEEPTPEPQTCEECFTQFLTAQQITAFEDAINMDIEAQCQILEDSLVFNPLEFEVELEAVDHNLDLIGVDDETAGQIIECLERVFGFEPLEE